MGRVGREGESTEKQDHVYVGAKNRPQAFLGPPWTRAYRFQLPLGLAISCCVPYWQYGTLIFVSVCVCVKEELRLTGRNMNIYLIQEIEFFGVANVNLHTLKLQFLMNLTILPILLELLKVINQILFMH